MAALFVGMVAVAVTVVAVASSLAAYAQRRWAKERIADAGTVRPARPSYFFRPLGDVAGFGEQLRDVPARYGYAEARRAG